MKITKLYPPKNNAFVLEELPFRSQTLFGALANCYATLFGKKSFSEFLSLFDKGKIGSVFPALKIAGKEIFFLPRPFLSRLKTDSDKDDFSSKKKVKKIHWLSLKAMKFLANSIREINGEFFHSIDFEKDLTIIGKEFLIMKNELPSSITEKIKDISFYRKSDVVRVNVSRFGENSTPFEQTEISLFEMKIKLGEEEIIQTKMFLYFPEDIETNEKWEAAKQLFADEGIGGKRNLGKGYFDKVETAEIIWETTTIPKLYLLLSNLIPKKEELKNIQTYEIGKDDGFITFGYASAFKKDAIFYLKEGSVIKSQIGGKIVSQQFKDNTIYRYGKAFLLPLGNENKNF